MMSGFFESLWRRIFPPPREIRSFGAGDDAAAPAAGCRLYVGNLSYNAKEEQLRDLFSRYGMARSVDLIRDRFTRRLKGYAFVEMATGDEARRALQLNGTEFLGRKIVVSEAKSKGASPSNGGSQSQGGAEAGVADRAAEDPKSRGSSASNSG
jgi:RNA recognition motif-containing protein